MDYSDYNVYAGELTATKLLQQSVMSRDNHVVLSDEEHDQLVQFEKQHFGTTQIPHGVAIEQLVQHVLDCDK